jgi:hypothetical protein
METIFQLIAILAVVVGTLFSVVGVVGFIRLPDVYTRFGRGAIGLGSRVGINLASDDYRSGYCACTWLGRTSNWLAEGRGGAR